MASASRLASHAAFALACLLAAGVACTSGSPSSPALPAPVRPSAAPAPPDPPPAADPADAITDPLHGLPTGGAQLAALCARGLGDPVSKAFCADPTSPPVITSLADLEALLGLAFVPGNAGNGTGGNPAFVLIGNSSSLVARFTSAINPRALIFTPPNRRARVGPDGKPVVTCAEIEPRDPLPTFVAIGFTRGEDFVEIVAKDPTATGSEGSLVFFLFEFDHECARTPQGCSPADLLTPAGEAHFAPGYSLYEDRDLADTILDCKQCHQPHGPGTPKILRMQELQNPWGHFFRNNRVNGQVLMADYRAAHGTSEAYGGIPGVAIFNPDTSENAGFASNVKGGGPDPSALQGLVENEGFCESQENEYDTDAILKEVQAGNPAQPGVNVPMGTSATWMTLFANAKSGRVIPTPYHDIKVTDPAKLAAMTEAYVQFTSGARADLPDVRDVLLDGALSDLTFRPSPELDGRGMLSQMCGQCHNARLDQSLSRALFRVDELDRMSRAEKDKAIHRLMLPPEAARHMPPHRSRDFAPDELARVVGALQE